LAHYWVKRITFLKIDTPSPILQSEPLRGFLENVSLKEIVFPNFSLRDDLGQIDDLVQSISEHGVLQPVLLRPIGTKYELIAGCRRFEACKRLRKFTIPSHIIHLDDKESYEVALIENLQRRTLNVVEEARAFEKYVSEYGYGGVSDLARKIGKSEQFVSSRIGILRLPQDILTRLTTRVVTYSIVRELANLSPEDQSNIAEIAVNQKLTTRAIKKIVKRAKNSSHDDSRSPNYLDLQTKLKENAFLIDKSRLSLEICLTRLGDIIALCNEEDWMIKDLLLHSRSVVHEQIDLLIRSRKRLYRVN
jgi:ParB family chromosome partitioning protein